MSRGNHTGNSVELANLPTASAFVNDTAVATDDAIAIAVDIVLSFVDAFVVATVGAVAIAIANRHS